MRPLRKNTPGTIASGVKLGRVRIAAAVARPEANAAERPGRHIKKRAGYHHAAAAISLIGALSKWNTNAGLIARKAAAILPPSSPITALPTAYVDHTANPAKIGTRRNTASRPPTRS